MFGNIKGIMDKFKDMKENIGEFKEKFDHLKSKLDAETFTEESSDGTVRITMTKLATVKDIQIASGLLADKEHLEDTLVLTLNKALDKVKENAIQEAKEIAKTSLPNMPGLPL